MPRITISIPWPFSANDTRELLSFTFQVALVSYLAFYLIESLRPGFVSLYLNVDFLLWSVIITGVLSSIWPVVVLEVKRRPANPTWKNFIWAILVALVTMVVVWYKLSSLGGLANIIAPLSGLIVLGLSLLVYYDRDETKTSE